MQTIGCHEQLQIQYIQSFFVTHPQPFPTGLELSKSFFLAVFPFLPLPSEPSQPQFKRLTAAIVCFDSWACNTLRHHFGSLAILHKCNPLSFFLMWKRKFRNILKDGKKKRRKYMVNMVGVILTHCHPPLVLLEIFIIYKHLGKWACVIILPMIYCKLFIFIIICPRKQ